MEVETLKGKFTFQWLQNPFSFSETLWYDTKQQESTKLPSSRERYGIPECLLGFVCFFLWFGGASALLPFSAV